MNTLIYNGAKIKLFCPINKKWSNGIITNLYNSEGVCAVRFDDDSLSEPAIYNLNKYKYCIMKNKNNDFNKIKNDVYEVEAVTEKYLDKTGRQLYKVKWKGYSDNESTWEPIEHLHSAIKLVQAFENDFSWKIKKERKIETLEPITQNIEKYKWLVHFHKILSNPGTQPSLRWINDTNFEVSDIQTFTYETINDDSLLMSAKIHLARLENYGFRQMPVATTIRFTNDNFIHSNIQFLYNIDLTISDILLYQNRFFKFTKRKTSTQNQKQVDALKLYSHVEELKCWPSFLEGVSLDINKCHIWSEYETVFFGDYSIKSYFMKMQLMDVYC